MLRFTVRVNTNDNNVTKAYSFVRGSGKFC